ncbi:MAG: hypothetical protein JF886_06450 [Candidatus Dormibacteraeota bacterium]|uniref:Uncharacterized protein n=1 Tax=Candidatus Aeolococcus gillhamiae TaxID=3127015 RepID=A0A934JWG3_9BACT|nr:hypothetical protein [Candidatus Dormibacteraeota bacterium]
MHTKELAVIAEQHPDIDRPGSGGSDNGREGGVQPDLLSEDGPLVAAAHGAGTVPDAITQLIEGIVDRRIAHIFAQPLSFHE